MEPFGKKEGNVEQDTATAVLDNTVFVAPTTLLLISGAVAASLQALNVGMMIGLANQSAPVVAAHFGITTADYRWSWVTSCFPLGGIVGGSSGGIIVGMIGPKWTQLFNNAFWMGSGFLLCFAPNIVGLMFGRILGGIASGVASASCPMWVNDCSPDQSRGIFGIFYQLFATIGILLEAIFGLTQVLGNEKLWRLQYSLFCIPAAIHLVIFFFMPDSPAFLITKGNVNGARAALQSLRGKDYNPEPELSKIQMTFEAEQAEALSKTDAIKILFTKQYIQQTIVALGLQVWQQLSGINAVMFYSGTIFVEAGGNLSPQNATLVVMAVNMGSTFIAIPLIDWLGRRWLLLGGFAGMTLWNLLFALGVNYHWDGATIAFMLLFIVFFAVTAGPIPWLVMCEVFPGNIRPGAVGLAVFTNWTFTFCVGLFYPPLQVRAKQWSFFFFMCCSTLATIFTFFLVPETKGKSINEIQEVFAKRIDRFM